MNCEWVKDNVVLYVYDELADDGRHELEQHVARCASCAEELKSARDFRSALSAPVEEPSPNLLVACRMRLQESLETTTQQAGWTRWVLEPAVWFRQMRFAPALAMALVMVGFAGGALATYSIVRKPIGPGPVQGPAAEASVAAITGITQEPGGDKVQVKYNSMVPQSVEGSLSDPRIQQLLLFAARNNYNSGVRLDSIQVLTQKPEDAHIREMLEYALRYDTNPGVRLKALDALGPFVKEDPGVRNAILEALVNDNNSGVRTEAIRLLQPVMADGSVRHVLQHLANDDKNPYIRSQSKSVLASLPEID